MANIYLKRLAKYSVKFAGINCPLDERLKRLKTRTDNLFLTEDFLAMQNDLFDQCKEFYDMEFDSSKMDSSQISGFILSSMA